MVRKGLVGFTRYGFLTILGRKGLGAAISPTGVVFLEGGGRQTFTLPKRPPPTLSAAARRGRGVPGPPRPGVSSTDGAPPRAEAPGTVRDAGCLRGGAPLHLSDETPGLTGL